MDVLMPQFGETVTEGTVSTWHRKAGEHVEADETLLEVETDKANMEIPAPVSGTLTEILVEEGQTVQVGAKLAEIRAAGDVKSTPRESGLSPVVRKLLAEHGIDPTQIRGTGRGGRLKREDVLTFIESRQVEGEPKPPPGQGKERMIHPLSRVRKRTAQHMVRSKSTSPHVLQAVEVDFDEVEKVRQVQQPGWKKKESFTLTYLPFVARAVCDAIADFPHVNASLEGDNLVVYGRVNLAIAVDLNFKGLVAPVIKDAHHKSLPDLAREIHVLADRARQGRLKPEDLTEGTYTISNSGSFGTLITAPIISQPQVAILSTDAVNKRPVVVEGPKDDHIVIHPVGVLAQSFDHRAFDGAYSAAFLGRIKEILQTRDWAVEFASPTRSLSES